MMVLRRSVFISRKDVTDAYDGIVYFFNVKGPSILRIDR